MKLNYERLAWTVLLIAFVLCVTLAISVPVTLQWYVRSSYIGQSLALDTQEGNLLVTCPGTDAPIAVNSREDNLCQGRENIWIATGATDQGSLQIRSRSAITATLASVQIYRGTQLWLQQATTPRFPHFSAEPDSVALHMSKGRIRVTVPAHLARAMSFQITTPQSLVRISEGSASVEVSDHETQVIGHEGQTTVIAAANRSEIKLPSAQRVAVPTGSGVTGLMPAARNLLGQSDLRESLGTIWKPYTVDPQIASESRGEIASMAVEGRTVVDFSRIGRGFAETGIRQELGRDIRDFRSLQLRIVLRVIQQDVPLCGTAGTECPVMVRMEYVDAEGETRSWQQGFYALPDSNVPANPPFCVTCNPRNDHILTVTNQWYSFESDNLIAILNKIGPTPVLLRSISIYASGHLYQSQVAEVELLGQE